MMDTEEEVFQGLLPILVRSYNWKSGETLFAFVKSTLERNNTAARLRVPQVFHVMTRPARAVCSGLHIVSTLLLLLQRRGVREWRSRRYLSFTYVPYCNYRDGEALESVRVRAKPKQHFLSKKGDDLWFDVDRRRITDGVLWPMLFTTSHLFISKSESLFNTTSKGKILGMQRSSLPWIT